ncbi:MAG: DUF192 domain-containing protein [Candidatus Portnoybacteria bacterium]|nr:DUF192 domain-containing protein [Candidatus Portnoybacteria bacterium]
MQRALISLLIILLAVLAFSLREGLPFNFIRNKNLPFGQNLVSRFARNQRVPVTIGDATFSVEVVTTQKGYIQGLSGRKALPDNEGMLFVFKSADYYPIWMKGMMFGIDIIWMDEKFRIVDIKENVPPESFPKTFYPSKPARYVLEVNAGEVKKSNVTIESSILGLPYEKERGLRK